MYSLGIEIFSFVVNSITPHQGRREGKGQSSYQGEDEEEALRRGERKGLREGKWVAVMGFELYPRAISTMDSHPRRPRKLPAQLSGSSHPKSCKHPQADTHSLVTSYKITMFSTSSWSVPWGRKLN